MSTSQDFKVNNPFQFLFDLIIARTQSTGATVTLPAPLQSIADLTTTGNEMLYTTGVDTYATLSNTDSYGRDFLIQTSQSTAQSYMGVRVGTDVQAQSSVLSGLAATALTADDLIYATSATSFTSTPSTSFGRSLLNETSAETLRSTLNVIGATGASSTDNALVKWAGTSIDTVQNSAATLSDAGLLTTSGIAVDTIDPNTGATITIDGNAIPSATWPFVASIDQDVSTSAAVTFDTVAATSMTVTDAVTSNTQVANKAYVDAVAGSGLQPIEAARVASTGALSATYSAGSEEFTSTINGAINIDSVALAADDRIVVKDEGGGTGTSNGVYRVTTVGDGSNPYVIKRTTDFNDAAEPIPANTFIFVSEGTVNAGTQWILNAEVTTVDTDPVQWDQFGGGGGLTAGSGIDITGDTISVDASSTFLNAPLGFAQGGTNVASFGAGDRLVQVNAGNTALETSTLSTSDVVTLTGTQVLQNKTMTGSNNIIKANFLGTTTTDVDVSSAAAPSANQVLTATSGTAATWQTLTFTPTTSREVTVAASGGDYTTIGAALAAIGVDSRLTPAASSTNSILIKVAPGSYTESNPLVVPPYVTIAGDARPLNTIVNASDATQDLFVLSYAASMRNIDARGVTTSGKAAFRISYAVGAGPTTSLVSCIARGCPVGFYCNGTGSQFSSVALFYSCNAVSTAAGPVESAFLADAGAVTVAFSSTVSGFFAGSINLDNGYHVTGSDSIMLLYSCDVSFVGTAYNCDSGAEIRANGGNVGNFEDYGLDLGAGGSEAILIGIYFQDNTALFASQKPIRTQTGSTLLQIDACILRQDLIDLDSGTTVAGVFNSLPDPSGEYRSQVVGELAVGLAGRGAESVFGEGDSTVVDMEVKRYNASTTLFDDITSTVRAADGSTVAAFPSNTAGDILYIANTNNYAFPGIKTTIGTAATPAGCNSASTEPPTYIVAWEYWNGSSWVEFRHMWTLSDTPFTPYRRDSFLAGTYQVRFGILSMSEATRPLPSTSTFVSSYGPGGANKWITSGSPRTNWTQTTIDGLNAFWVRCRLISPLTVVPTIDQIKLHTNRAELNADGTLEFFGSSRTRRDLPYISIFNKTDSPAFSPSNSDLYFSDNIEYDMLDNSFNNGNTDRISFTFKIPCDVCTSCSMLFRWRWVASNTSTGNVQWTIRWCYGRPFAIDSGAVSTVNTGTAGAPTTQVTEQGITFTTPGPGTSLKMVDDWLLLDISDTVNSYNMARSGIGDIIHLSITRDGGAGADTFTGNARMVEYSAIYVSSFYGASIGSS